MSTAASINSLLDDKLYQVIGSTPASIAESLRKVDLADRSSEGAQIFAVCIFAAAVNKATLETFLADNRFANARPILSAALSISGRSNMTAITLLGHCFLATDMSSEVTFAKEFRKKMGQNHLWAGELTAGSLSDKQREILKEKKRVTAEAEAKALGNGFLKHTGILSGTMSALEAEYFGVKASAKAPARQAARIPVSSSASVSAPAGVSASRYAPAQESAAPPAMRAGRSKATTPEFDEGVTKYETSNRDSFDVPNDCIDYRKNVLGQNDEDILESLARNGLNKFVANTRRLIAEDPTGARTKGASRAGG